MMMLVCGVMMIFAGCKKDDKNDEPGGNGGGNGTTSNVIYGNGVTDVSGNTYKSIIIGEQEWMAENLKTTKYKDRTAIPNVTDNTAWGELTTPAYCWCNNDATQGYGALYNWYAVNTGKLCPTGWHVPSDDEWTVLTDYLATQGYDENNNAIPLKATFGWNYNGNGTDVYGFSAFPGGARDLSDGGFSSIGGSGYWWSATEYYGSLAWYCDVSYFTDGVYRGGYNKTYGLSVRCLRD